MVKNLYVQCKIGIIRLSEEEIRQKYSTENEVEKARAMMEELEQEEKAVSGKERAYEV